MYARFFHFWAPKALKQQKTGFWRFLAIFIFLIQMVDIGPNSPRFERFRKRVLRIFLYKIIFFGVYLKNGEMAVLKLFLPF